MTFSKINSGVKRFIENKEGASAIEYVIIIAMVALVVVVAMPTVGAAVTGVLTKITTVLTGLS